MSQKELTKRLSEKTKKRGIAVFDKEPEKLVFESSERKVKMVYPQYFF